MKHYSLELILLFIYQAELPGAKGLLLNCEYQAGLPTAVGSHCLDACLLISSKLLRYSDGLTIYSGLLIPNISNQIPSNKAHTKYPVIIEENISEKLDSLPNIMKGNIDKHPANRINLTLGNCLANCKSSSGNIFQSSGIDSSSGSVFHNLFLRLYNTISNRMPTIGYKTKQNSQKLPLLKNKPKENDKIPTIMPFGTIASSPDRAITFGLESTFPKLIRFPFTIMIFTKTFYLSIAQNNFNLNYF